LFRPYEEATMNAMFGPLRRRRLAVVTVAIFAVAGGIAYGSIPDAGGVYHACLAKTGAIRIIDTDTDVCKSVETPITFNQQGQPGDPGTSPTVAPVAAGDSHCAAGGAAITDAAGTTAYVCSGLNGTDGTDGKDGTPFSGTFTSPNGQYSISVTDTGVTVAGAGTTVDLSGTGLKVETANGLTLKGGTDVSLESGGGLAVKAGTTLGLSGALLTLNNSGPTCLRAARLGDSVLATSTNQGALSTGFITDGSPTVCIGG
jgi:hypothetical protein